jgi:cytochrome P450
MRRSRHVNHAPGPRAGALWQSVRRLQQQPLAEYIWLRRQFGDVVRLPLLPYPLYLLSHPHAVQQVLRDNASNYRKGILFRSIAALQGQGLLTSEGELWRHQRHLSNPAFRQRHVAHFAPLMAEEAQAVVESWRSIARTGKPINIAAWMHRLTFRIVGRALLGIAPAALDEVARQLQAVGEQIMPYLMTRLTRTWAPPAWLPTPHRWRFRGAVSVYNTLAQRLITMRRQTLPHDRAAATDVLAMLIAAGDDATDTGLTEQQLRDAVITFIGAGVETAAQVLSWTCYLLARHPEAAQRLRAELAEHVEARLPTLEDLPSLAYGRMVLDEAMRLYPPAAILPRQANAADEIGGYAVPSNAVVVLSPYVTHRHPDFWPEPERFCPERFTMEQVTVRPRFAYFPFGEGARLCIGKSFALMEMQLLLATIAQAYSLRLVAEPPTVPFLATTLQPRGGLWMTVQARQ